MAMKIDWAEAARFLWWKLSHIITHTIWIYAFRLRCYGIRNYPNAGPVLLCSNHISTYDPSMVGTTQYRVVHFVAKKELFTGKKLLKYFIQAYGAFQLDREKPMTGVKTAMKYLKSGKTVLIYPEGTRSLDGEIGKGLTGTGMLAYSSKARIIPVFVAGGDHKHSEHKNASKFPYCYVYFGKEIDMSEYRAMGRGKETYQKIADRMIEELKGLKEIYDRTYKFKNKNIYE